MVNVQVSRGPSCCPPCPWRLASTVYVVVVASAAVGVKVATLVRAVGLAAPAPRSFPARSCQLTCSADGFAEGRWIRLDVTGTPVAPAWAAVVTVGFVVSAPLVVKTTSTQ